MQCTCDTLYYAYDTNHSAYTDHISMSYKCQFCCLCSINHEVVIKLNSDDKINCDCMFL